LWQSPQLAVIDSLALSVELPTMSCVVWQSEQTAVLKFFFSVASRPCADAVQSSRWSVWQVSPQTVGTVKCHSLRSCVPRGGTSKVCTLWQSLQMAFSLVGSSLFGLAWKDFL
jgi:hypothetical protein